MLILCSYLPIITLPSQWLKFPIRYGDLCPTSRLVLTIEDVSNGQRVVVGGSSIPLFNRRGLLKIGPRKLTVWRGRRGDSAVRSTTPYKLASRTAFLDVLRKRLIRRVQERKLEQRRNAHAQMHNGKAERESGSQECAWLDAVSMDRVVELVRERATTHADPSHLKRLETMFPELNPDVRIAYDLHEEAYAKQTADLSSAMRDHFDPSSEAFGSLSPSDLHRAEALLPFLTVEFPEFPLPVVYHQKPCNPQLSEILPLEEKGRLFVLHDPEMIRESPIEHKLEKMALSGLSVGVGDKTLKPSVRERNLIEQILRSPTKRMTTEAKTLFWRYIYI
jgi:phosphatidylinositol 3-kinase